MDLKTVKLELYLRLEISSGKKAELQDRLLEAIRLKKTQYNNKAAVKLTQVGARKEKNPGINLMGSAYSISTPTGRSS